MNTKSLMSLFVKTFPQKLRELNKLDPEGNLEFRCLPPKDIDGVYPTFAKNKSQPVSPMLKLRFEFCSTVTLGPEKWLALDEVPGWLSNNGVNLAYVALRENWPDSIPARFDDERISLFSICPGVPESVVYLAWPPGEVEPIVAQYSTLQADEFESLDEFLKWQLS